MDNQNFLEQEWQELKQIITTQAEVIKDLKEKVMQSTSSPNQTPVQASVLTKPRDIPVLELQDLEGLEGTGRLALFLNGIEQYALTDSDRIQIAKSRVSRDIALLIQNHQDQDQCTSSVEIKKFPSTEFSVDLSIDRAWKEIEAVKYHWEDSPLVCTNYQPPNLPLCHR